MRIKKERKRIQRKLAKDQKATKLLSVSKHHLEKCVNWPKKHVKTDF